MTAQSGRSSDKNIGQILVEMGACTDGQVARAAQQQLGDSEEKRIGMYLVALGFISEKQLEVALNAQEGLRSRSRSKRAHAMADIAEAATVSNIDRARRLRERSGAVHRLATGDAHPAVTPAMLANGKDG